MAQLSHRALHVYLPVIASALLLIFFLLPVTVGAESCTPESSAASTKTQPGQASQRAVIDPATGRLDNKRQFPERDFQALAEANTRIRQNIIVMDHPDGSKSADVGTAYMTTLEARIVAGELVTCHERRWAKE